MNKINTIARIIVTPVVGVPLIVAVIAVIAIWYLTGGFTIYLTYLFVDTINTIFGGDPEKFWLRNSRGLEKIRCSMVNTINMWFN